MNRRTYNGSDNPNWKGGMPFCDCGKQLTNRKYKQCIGCYITSRLKGDYYVTEKGYLRNRKTTQLQHREIMEKYLGRKLQTSENIHHINHNKLDNRIENLQLISKGDHTIIHRPHLANVKHPTLGMYVKKGKSLENYAPSYLTRVRNKLGQFS